MRRQKRKRKSFILPISISVGIIIIYLSMHYSLKIIFILKQPLTVLRPRGKLLKRSLDK